MRFTALFLSAGLMGCPSDDKIKDSNEPDDSGDTDSGSDVVYVARYVTIDFSINGIVQEDPVGVCLHETDGETGDEAVLAGAQTTGQAIEVNVPEDGQEARAWVGPSNAAQSSDGHRILEYSYDGQDRQWVHPIADFSITEDCEETIAVNGYFPYDLFHCTMDSYWYDDEAPDFKGDYIYTSEGDHWLEVENGQDILDDGDEANGLEEFLANDCVLQSFGSTFAVDCPDDAMWTIDSSWTGNGFTISASTYDNAVSELTCTL